MQAGKDWPQNGWQKARLETKDIGKFRVKVKAFYFSAIPGPSTDQPEMASVPGLPRILVLVSNPPILTAAPIQQLHPASLLQRQPAEHSSSAHRSAGHGWKNSSGTLEPPRTLRMFSQPPYPTAHVKKVICIPNS